MPDPFKRWWEWSMLSSFILLASHRSQWYILQKEYSAANLCIFATCVPSPTCLLGRMHSEWPILSSVYHKTHMASPLLCAASPTSEVQWHRRRVHLTNLLAILNAASLPLAWQNIAMSFYLHRKWIVQTNMPVGQRRYTMHCKGLLPPSSNTFV